MFAKSIQSRCWFSIQSLCGWAIRLPQRSDASQAFDAYFRPQYVSPWTRYDGELVSACQFHRAPVTNEKKKKNEKIRPDFHFFSTAMFHFQRAHDTALLPLSSASFSHISFSISIFYISELMFNSNKIHPFIFVTVSVPSNKRRLLPFSSMRWSVSEWAMGDAIRRSQALLLPPVTRIFLVSR